MSAPIPQTVLHAVKVNSVTRAVPPRRGRVCLGSETDRVTQPPCGGLPALKSMVVDQHDSATTFQFILSGNLAGDQVPELEHAWTTAKSVLSGKELVVDVSGITYSNELGVDLLSRMRNSGARPTTALPPKSEEHLRSLGLPVAAPNGRSIRTRVLRFLRLRLP